MKLPISAAIAAVLAACFGALPATAKPSEALPPPGANNWSCQPSDVHPHPVVLVHGLSATMFENWGYFSPELAKRGYCVYALTYGLDPRFGPLTEVGAGVPGGVIPMEQSAAELAAFVDKVLAQTGADKVDLIGHSEGTVMPQYWLKTLGGAPKVDKYVAMTPLYDGTKFLTVNTVRDIGSYWGLSKPVLDLFGQTCGSCSQFLTGSEYMKEMNEGGPAAPGVRYTTIMTKYDELVIPYTSGYLAGAEHNYVIQDLCPADPAEHGAVAFDPLALQIALNALDPDHAQPLVCNRLPYAPDNPLVTPAPAPTTPPPPETEPESVGGAIDDVHDAVANTSTTLNSGVLGLLPKQ